MNDSEAAEILSANLGKLPEQDQGFANSLLGQLQSKGNLFPKQWKWVHILADRSSGKGPEPVRVGDMAGVIDILQSAQKKMKFPKIRLRTVEGHKVVVTLAGSKSKYPGHLNLYDGGSYQDNVWYGRISPEGIWYQNDKVDKEVLKSVEYLVCALGADPKRVALDQYNLSKVCSFCGTGLKDPRSLKVGYGPECAETWNLPWG